MPLDIDDVLCSTKFKDTWVPMDMQPSSTIWRKNESHRGLQKVGVFTGPGMVEFNLKIYSYYPHDYEGITSDAHFRLASEKDNDGFSNIVLDESENILPSFGAPVEPTALISNGYINEFQMKLTVDGHPLEVKCEILD